MASQFPAALNPVEDDIKKMLVTAVHIGTRKLDPAMGRYVWKRRDDGVHIINLQKTWEKLTLAARVIVAIENPQDVVLISANPHGQRAILKFAKYTGCQAITGRFTPGTFTNQIQERFQEPRLLILSDPATDHQPIREASYVNIPTIAFCNTDAPLQHVDIAIPCGHGKNALGLMWYLLAREVLYLRNTIPRGQPWDVMCDLFFFRTPEDEKQEGAEEGAALVPAVTADWAAQAAPEWAGDQGAPGSDWAASGAPAPAAADSWGAAGDAGPTAAAWDNTATAGSWDATAQ
jgi:small subunit ribosomal protein SAe